MLVRSSYSLRRLFTVSLAAIALATSITVHAGPRACEDLFKKEPFFNPSIVVTETGRIETKLTNSKSVVGNFLNRLARLVYRPLTIDKIEKMMERLVADPREETPFWVKLSDAFGLDIQIAESALDTIPKTGPLVIVSNHAMNGVEGIALAALVSKVRPDVKVALTGLLDAVPGLAENSIVLNPYGGEQAKIDNVIGRQKMVDDLRAGHALIIFPTGTVSQKQKWRDNSAVDGRWRNGVFSLLREVPETRVQSIYVNGQPSTAFLNVAFLNERMPKPLRALQMPIGAVFHVREIGSRMNQAIGLTIGPVVEGASVLTWGSAAQAMDRLRSQTLTLKYRSENRVSLRGIRDELPIAPAGNMTEIRGELETKASVLYDMAPGQIDKRMLVYFARGRDIPKALAEIGRLREISFREVGEGSGQARDLDDFDGDYWQLIAVDKQTGAIAGGYRIGMVDELLAKYGPPGLYTSRFFDHTALLNTYLSTSLELGRSFVTPDFQRSFALLALFNGIGRFVARNPRYKYLMGPVSISGEVSDRSKAILVEHLRRYYESPDASLVTPKTPLRADLKIEDEDQAFLAQPRTLRELTKKVDGIEQSHESGSSMPPLIPIYIGLGAKFFKFNLDADFNTLDGLIVTDLSKLSVEKLKPYMGEDGAASFVSYHRWSESRRAQGR